MSASQSHHLESLKAVQTVFAVTLGLNALVCASKLIWGYHTHTLSMVADGFHSLLDTVSNVVGIISLGFSMKPADHNHPYGHRKFEAMAAIIISFFIFLTCFEIASESIARFFSNVHTHPAIGWANYAIIIVTLIINLLVSNYEHRRGKQLKNDLLLADAKHTMSDCLVSVSVLGSMLAVQAGWLWADTVLALVVSAIILKVGFELILVHFSALTDEAVLNPDDIQALVLSVPGVMDCHKIRSRGLKDHVFIDLHIQVDPLLTVKEAHGISYQVEDKLENAFDGRVGEVLVHIEEYEAPSPVPQEIKA